MDSLGEAAMLEIAHANLATSAALIRSGKTDEAKRLLNSLTSSKLPPHLREASQALMRNT
jgi:hypothetical protein